MLHTEEIRKTLEKQLELLSERSREDVAAIDLCNLTREMVELVEALRVL